MLHVRALWNYVYTVLDFVLCVIVRLFYIWHFCFYMRLLILALDVFHRFFFAGFTSFYIWVLIFFWPVIFRYTLNWIPPFLRKHTPGLDAWAINWSVARWQDLCGASLREWGSAVIMLTKTVLMLDDSENVKPIEES